MSSKHKGVLEQHGEEIETRERVEVETDSEARCFWAIFNVQKE